MNDQATAWEPRGSGMTFRQRRLGHRKWYQRPGPVGVLAFIVGLLVGWWLLGWQLFPVEWTDARPIDLAPGYRVDYLAMVADSYARTGNTALAQKRLEGFDRETVVRAADELAAAGLTAQAEPLRQLADLLGRGTPPTAPPSAPSLPASETGSLEQMMMWAVGLILLGFLLIIGVIAGRRYLAGLEAPVTAQEEAPSPPQPVAETFGRIVHQTALGQAELAHYTRDQTAYEEEFQIRDEEGRLLGAYGLKVPSYLTPTERASAPAFELWLSDWFDRKAVSKCLMSRAVYMDQNWRAQLTPSGEAVLLEPGKVIHLDTARLHLEAEVIEVTDAPVRGGAEPERYFDSLTLRLLVVPQDTSASQGDTASGDAGRRIALRC